ncbi:hypothetical protein [Comamonas sp. B21-038]|uniref:hypothetical protein n=1 Tax=Comamonas sp. B21-038 TaxID=2918299 RepID=UPI001EFB7F43|nr:hypothetical protein [Comamonas sp. B21-038]ULR87389.1 hypothetical protein MJ205_13030 [Comamonas sp. B21-038]
MRNEYRVLVETVLSHEGKLRELALRKAEAEKNLASINQCIAFNEDAIRSVECQISEIERRAGLSEA